MTQGVLSVALHRDGISTPWGFRLHGGRDVGYPMVIQRVFLGSPSEGELQRGDVLLQIQGSDTGAMTHMEAYDVIKAAGTQLRLVVHRLPGAPQSPGVRTPTSPIPAAMNPYAKLLREQQQHSPRAPRFEPMSPPRVTPPPPVQQYPAKEYCFSPLPTTPILDLGAGFFAPSPKSRADAEVQEYRVEKSKEKAAISHQGYRTLPLIAPRPKTRHDVPMGSYLRHVHDPNWKGGRSSVNPPKPVFFNSLPTPTYSKTIAQPRTQHRSAAIFERPIDDSSQLVHHQFNSPLYLYSQKNVDEAIKEQTGYNPAKPKLNVANQVPQGGPLSPGGTFAPARAGTKLTNIVDITLSPTFQLIQEEEKRSATPTSDGVTPPPMRRSPGGMSPPMVNTFGSPRENIHQSGSFKSLMTTLTITGGQQE